MIFRRQKELLPEVVELRAANEQLRAITMQLKEKAEEYSHPNAEDNDG